MNTNTQDIIAFARTQKFGICMEGNEAAFATWLLEANPKDGTAVTYLEVGVASGQTLGSACRILSFIDPDRPILAVGIDIGGTDCFDLGAIHRSVAGIPRLQFDMIEGTATWGLGQFGSRVVDFALIDACHGSPCAKADFIAVAARMRVGGIVAFHDASPQCQGHHHQPHCGTGIDVRAALMDLGLLPRSATTALGVVNGRRWSGALPGWQLLEDVDATHGCVFVQKTA